MGVAGAHEPSCGAAFQEEGALTFHGASHHSLRHVAIRLHVMVGHPPAFAMEPLFPNRGPQQGCCGWASSAVTQVAQSLAW